MASQTAISTVGRNRLEGKVVIITGVTRGSAAPPSDSTPLPLGFTEQRA